jgi:hypothetical protein
MRLLHFPHLGRHSVPRGSEAARSKRPFLSPDFTLFQGEIEFGSGPTMPGGKQDRPTWLRYSGMGLEFAAAVAGFVLIGYWIGRHYGNETRGVLIGAVLGLIGGGYNFIRSALQLTREMEQRAKKSKGDDES